MKTRVIMPELKHEAVYGFNPHCDNPKYKAFYVCKTCGADDRGSTLTHVKTVAKYDHMNVDFTLTKVGR